MPDFKPQYLGKAAEEYPEVTELETVLYELESANVKASTLKVSLEFWRRLQLTKHIRINRDGDIFYKYLSVKVDPKQETNFLLY